MLRPSDTRQTTFARAAGAALVAFLSCIAVASLRAADCLDYAVPGQEPELGTVSLLPDGGCAEMVFVGDLVWLARTNYGALVAVDISDPGTPTVVGVEPVEVMNETFGLAVSGDLAFVSWLQWGNVFGVRVFDISDPTDPIDIGNFTPPPGTWPTRLLAAGDLVYMSLASQFGILDVSDPTAPVLIGQLAVGGFGPLFLAGELVYVIHDSGDPLVVDVSDPTAPTVVGELPVNGEATDLTIADGLAYVSTREGLEIIDVADPTVPAWVGGVAIPGVVISVTVSGGLTYVGTRETVVEVIDTRMPQAPVHIGTVDVGLDSFNIPWSVAVHAGRLAVLTDGDLRLAPLQCPLDVTAVVPTPLPELRLSAQPNPFNPRTTVGFELPAPARVTLTIYDVAGRRVRMLLDAVDFPAGAQQILWQGHDDLGRSVASGTYFCSLETGQHTVGHRVTLVR